MKKTLFAICAVLFLAVVAVAADPAGKPHKMRMVAHLTQALDLTEEQQAAARQLHEEMMVQAGPLMEQQHEQWEELHALLESANPDPTEVGKRAIAAHATRAQLKALHEGAKTRFSALLTEEQKAELEELHERRGEGRHRFPGFGHGPGF